MKSWIKDELFQQLIYFYLSRGHDLTLSDFSAWIIEQHQDTYVYIQEKSF